MGTPPNWNNLRKDRLSVKQLKVVAVALVPCTNVIVGSVCYSDDEYVPGSFMYGGTPRLHNAPRTLVLHSVIRYCLLSLY